MYYVIVYTKNNVGLSTNANFDICITANSLSRMNEVWQRTVLSSGAINTPWEVTYGPDGYLWVTGSQDYKAYRMDPNTGTKTQILDLSSTSTDFPSIKAQFNYATVSPKPQGGFAGLAIHPQFNSGKPYVYISYVRKLDSASVLNSSCGYFKNSIVRFTYNSSSGQLESPVVLVDTLPGGNDHNSQRMIIAPVGGTYYLFYGQGDMGAGQLACQLRPNHAQDTGYYEGKILRFNLEPDADAGSFDQWIPNDNPYNHGGVQSAIWDVGIRNNQGFAYNPITDKLYGSMHGPYTDDEINIFERYKNYGHPLIEGYSWDGNYNGTTTPGLSTSYTAGETYATNSGISTLAPIGDEAHNADSINASGFAPYKEPLFSAYPSGGTGYPVADKTVAAIWSASTKPGNSGWPSEAWSGMDVYTNTLIPGWKNSLLVCGLKWGRVLRLKLNNTGDSVIETNGADTIAYFQGKNRYRDLAISPDGKDLFVSNEGTSATGPGGVSPPATVPNCTNCIIKYTFLGYADAGGKSTIPDAIDVSDTSLAESIPVNTVDSATTVTIDATNNMLWVPITGPDGNILAEIYANGNNLGTIHSAFYKHSGSIRIKGGIHYLDRNITITPQNQPSGTVKIRLYISKAEFDALDADGASGISAITDLKILTNEDVCGSTMSSSTTLINPTYAEAHGTGGYVLQGDITSFSSFYFASANVILPMQLVSFTGSLKNNAALLQWKTTNEINTSHFEIERSINGVDFTKIGSETAKGNSTSTSNYSYIDYDAANQSSNVVYYRLKIFDIDGSSTYSQIVSVTFNSTTTFLVRPNPVQQILYIHGKKDFHKPLQAELYDLSGKVLRKEQEFKNDFSIDVTSLKPGVYILKMYNGYDVEEQVYKVIKQ
jgi:PQQ-dependent dehydrogenase (s-GDH family)